MKHGSRRNLPYNTKTWNQTWNEASGTMMYVYGNGADVNGTLYIGCLKSDTYADVCYLNNSTRTWTTCNWPDSTGWGEQYVVNLGGVLYSGNVNGNPAGGYQKLTPPSTWTGIGMPASLVGIDTECFIVHSGKLYVSGQDDDVWEYQSGTTWASIGKPCGVGAAPVSIRSHAGSLYAWGINSAAPTVMSVYVWAGGTTWNAAGTFTPAGSGEFIRSASDGTNFYIIGRDNATLGETFKFTAPSTWTSIGNVGTGILQALIVEGRLLVTHGASLKYHDGSAFVAYPGYPSSSYGRWALIFFNSAIWLGEGAYASGSAKLYRLGLRWP